MSKEQFRVPRLNIPQLRLPIMHSLARMPDGTSVRVHKIEKPRPNPGDEAQHEALHVVPSGRIKSATIISNGNALGTTVPENMTAAAAAAPAAFGHRGVGHDLRVVQYGLGIDIESAKAAGRAAVSGQEDVVDEVAVLLEERGTIGQSDFDEARENVRKRRQGIHAVEVSIQSTHGELQVYKTESHRNNVLVPGEWLVLDNAA